MAQGGAKRIKGQLDSSESAPVVLSTEQEALLDLGASGAFDGATFLDLIEDAYKASGTAVSGMKAVLLGSENSGSGNLEPLKSSGGELFIRSSSQLPVSVNNASGASAVNIQDGGNSITVDGTVGVSGTVTVAGAVTNAGTFAVQVDGAALTSLQLIDDAIYTDGTGTVTKGVAILGQDGTNPQAIKTDSNGELQVDVLTMPNMTIGAAIPAGTNNIGDVDVASIAAGTNYIGKVRPTDGTTDAEIVPLAGYNAQAVAIVDGSGNQITSFGGGTQYTEDAAAASDPVGTVPILIRKDTPATVTSTDGDNVAQRGTNYGAAYVQVVTSAGAFVDSFGGAAAGVTYGTDTSMTVTALNSLANSATAGWQSIRVSNVSTRAKDYIIGIKLTMANTAPGNDKAAYVYICPFWTSDAGTTWYAASQGTTTLPTGAEGTTTIASPNNLRLLGVLNYTTQNMVLQDTFRLSDVFGTTMPQGFSIIVINFTGAAIAASTNLVSYTAIT
jgi:hypothetical protein